MSELQSLTKTLIQVVGSLQELLAKKETKKNSLEPEPSIKKTSDMTYIQFIKRVLESKKICEAGSKKSTFTLHEDLQLLYELSNYTQITNKTFEQIAKKKTIARTADALRNRYHDFLYRVTEKEMRVIVTWVEQYGLKGYIAFDENEVRVQETDPKENKEEKKRSRPASLQAEGKKLGKAPKLKNIPVNCKELNQVLKLYSKMVNVPIKTLIEKLDQLSGDLVELDNYIETKDSRMLWTAEEDAILRKGGVELQVLKNYRGNGVELRKKYLGIS